MLFLERLPNLQKLGNLNIGEHIEEMLQCDLDYVVQQIALMREAISLCGEEKASIRRELLEGIFSYEEDHVD